MPYFSKFYGIEVRDEIVQEWTNDKGEVDDMMAGLHEIRARHAEEKYDLKVLESKIRAKQPDLVNLVGKE